MNYIKIAKTCRNVMALSIGVLLVSCGGGGGSGSTTSATANALSTAQDGMVGRDVTVPTSTDGKLGFSFASVTGGCVQDNVTGLMWEVKTAGNWATTYSYAAANTFVGTTNTSNLCAHNDWRLPTADELQSIVDYSVATPGPTIDPTWFPNTKGGVFWSASSYVATVDQAWGVDFSNGFVGSYPTGDSHYVRVVRGIATGLNDTGITASQCFQTGSNSLVAC
ncbi:MAG: DUF1566 domain-containing protein [Gallionella sp.]